jgi:hypothetical protein
MLVSLAGMATFLKRSRVKISRIIFLQILFSQYTMLHRAGSVRRCCGSAYRLLIGDAAFWVRKQHSAAGVRRQFLDFFLQEKDHTFIRASPVVPFNDASLMFVNAGMNQFKSILQVLARVPNILDKTVSGSLYIQCCEET